MDPGTAILIATAVATAAQAGGSAYSGSQQKKAGKLRAHELKRETLANILNQEIGAGPEMFAQNLGSRSRLGKRKAQSLQDTADLVRGAFNI